MAKPFKIESKLNFSVPFEFVVEGATEGKTLTMEETLSRDFTIKGTAINSTTTRNGHKFVADELMKSAESLRNKPILKDHKNSVDSIVGRTLKTQDGAYFDESSKSIKFAGVIKDRKAKEMIYDGLITAVSVGAMVQETEETENGEIILRGIDFAEISLVAVPADPNAGFAKAICEAFNLETEETKMAEKTESNVSIEEFNKMQESFKAQATELNAFKEAEAARKAVEEKAKLEAEIEARVRAKIQAEAQAKPAVGKAAMSQPTAEGKASPFKMYADTSLGDKPGFGLASYEGMKRLSWRN